MVAFIDANRDELGVEPICEVLQVAPSTYYAAKARPLSARAKRDAVMIPILVALWTANYRVYGADKLRSERPSSGGTAQANPLHPPCSCFRVRARICSSSCCCCGLPEAAKASTAETST